MSLFKLKDFIWNKGIPSVTTARSTLPLVFLSNPNGLHISFKEYCPSGKDGAIFIFSIMMISVLLSTVSTNASILFLTELILIYSIIRHDQSYLLKSCI